MTDASSNTLGFTDGNTSGNDYAYWPDGSLKKDLNRGITQIDYNLLKLPSQLSFSSGKVVSYQYNAEGTKLSMSVVGGERRDYVGAYQYQYLTPSGGSRSVFEIGTDVGRYVPGSGYEYYLKDHLGSVRAVVKPNASGSPVVTQWTDYDPWGWELPALTSVSSLTTNRDKFNGKEAVSEFGIGLLDFGARVYDATIGRWGVIDPLAEVSRRWSPYVYGYNNPVRFVDPDGMEATDTKTTTEYTYSDGYSTQSSRTSTASLGYEGVGVFVERGGTSTDSQTQGGGQEPIKGGGFPKGEIRSTTEQNAVIRPADGLRYTEVEKASQLGVNIAGIVEGGFGLLKLGKWLKSLASFSKAVSEGSEDILKLFSGTEKAWQSGATPNSVYTYLSSDGKAVSNYIYNAEGKVIYQVDFGKHGKYLSGHGHEMSIPGNLGSGHQGHIPFNLVPSQYLQVPKGVSYATPIGH